MAENTKTPPNQDPRRTPQGDPNKPQKPSGTGSSGGDPDRNRQGSNMPGKPGQGQGQGGQRQSQEGGQRQSQEGGPDRSRTGRPMPGRDGEIGVDDIDDDEDAMPRTPPRPGRDE